VAGSCAALSTEVLEWDSDVVLLLLASMSPLTGGTDNGDQETTMGVGSFLKVG